MSWKMRWKRGQRKTAMTSVYERANQEGNKSKSRGRHIPITAFESGRKEIEGWKIMIIRSEWGRLDGSDPSNPTGSRTFRALTPQTVDLTHRFASSGLSEFAGDCLGAG